MFRVLEQFKRFCQDALGAPVELKLSHPVALAELYASPSPLMGRDQSSGHESMAKLGYNPFCVTIRSPAPPPRRLPLPASAMKVALGSKPHDGLRRWQLFRHVAPPRA